MTEIKPPDGAKRRFVFKVFRSNGGHLIAPNGSRRPLLKRDGSWSKCHSDGPLLMCENGIHGWTTWERTDVHANYPFSVEDGVKLLYLYELADLGRKGRALDGKCVARYGRVVMRFKPLASGSYGWDDIVSQFKKKFPNGKIRANNPSRGYRS